MAAVWTRAHYAALLPRVQRRERRKEALRHAVWTELPKHLKATFYGELGPEPGMMRRGDVVPMTDLGTQDLLKLRRELRTYRHRQTRFAQTR